MYFVRKDKPRIFEKKKIIVGYGAPAKATTLINFFNLEKYLSYVIDDNLLKNGKTKSNPSIKLSLKNNLICLK